MGTPIDSRTLARVRAEYLEMPGMRLTVQQVRRLCGIDSSACQAILDSLVDARFLSVTSDGSYVRFNEDRSVRARPLKATLDSIQKASAARRAS